MKKEAAFGALMVAYTMKKRFLIIGGAIMLAIGFLGAIPFGSIVINEAAQQELNPTTQRPEPIFFGIISPLYAEMTFIAIGVVGFSLLVLGVAMHQEEESKQLRQKQQQKQR
jgi:mannose/fructose/N-acetylgalactosamine-specific phosphotransferase system component IIC